MLYWILSIFIVTKAVHSDVLVSVLKSLTAKKRGLQLFFKKLITADL